MSRSYKKYPHSTSTVSWFKRYSNKRNRQREQEMLHEYELGNVPYAESLDFDDGGDFKKNGETYNIRDYVFVEFTNKYPPYYYLRPWSPTPKEWQEELAKMRRK